MNAHAAYSTDKHAAGPHPLIAPRARPIVAGSAPLAEPAIARETCWRQRPSSTREESIGIGRWSCAEPERDAPSRAAEDLIIAIALRPADFLLRAGADLLHDGCCDAGFVAVTGPGVEARASFRSSCDFLHLYASQRTLRAFSRPAAETLPIPGASRAWRDSAIDVLARSLVGCADAGTAGHLYRHSLATAILARVLGSWQRPPPPRPPASGLVPWRLKRVLAFIDSHLDAPLRLDDLARCAGLSRMHFAAQFRLAAGAAPHAFVVRRRIDRARTMLRESDLPLVQVALSVGFQTQAHFTTVFRRLTGETPGRWRQQEWALCSS